jgi:hypothetical protein
MKYIKDILANSLGYTICIVYIILFVRMIKYFLE